MKKYKLIKEYPGSPKLGTEIEFKKDAWYAHYLPKMRDNDDVNSIGCEEIKHYIEYWQEVVEKDYEILSFYAKNISGKGDNYVDPEYIWLPCTRNGYEKGKGWSRLGHETVPYSDEIILNHKGYGIHSVKRLSDGEVFTIGDQCEDGEIESFETSKVTDDLLISFKAKPLRQARVMKHCNKLKKPLFITEDGVDMYDGDEAYWINGHNWDITRRLFNKHCQYNPSSKYFSTKEAAEEYILMNKPCLSAKDILDTYQKDGLLQHIRVEEYLKQLVKLKL